MKIHVIATHLEYYNKWRRDNSEDPLSSLEQPNPKQLGITIDNAVKVLKKLKEIKVGREFVDAVHEKCKRPRNTTMYKEKLYALVIETLIEELESDK